MIKIKKTDQFVNPRVNSKLSPYPYNLVRVTANLHLKHGKIKRWELTIFKYQNNWKPSTSKESKCSCSFLLAL